MELNEKAVRKHASVKGLLLINLYYSFVSLDLDNLMNLSCDFFLVKYLILNVSWLGSINLQLALQPGLSLDLLHHMPPSSPSLHWCPPSFNTRSIHILHNLMHPPRSWLRYPPCGRYLLNHHPLGLPRLSSILCSWPNYINLRNFMNYTRSSPFRMLLISRLFLVRHPSSFILIAS